MKERRELQVFDGIGIQGAHNLTPEDIVSQKDTLDVRVIPYCTALVVLPSKYNVDNEVIYFYKLRKFYKKQEWFVMADQIYWKLILRYRVVILDGVGRKRDRLKLLGDRAREYVKWNKEDKKASTQAHISVHENGIKFNSRYFPEVAKYMLRSWNKNPRNPKKILIKESNKSNE